MFYAYRASSDAVYPLENLNAADLAGVMAYLHNEVVVSTPRKYRIDRIRRYKVTYKTTQEFFNVHHRYFGGFLAYDAAKCTTPICAKVYHQYGFIVGCQTLDTMLTAYRPRKETTWANCEPGHCDMPVWYSLPGPCPTEGLAQSDIEQKGSLNVYAAKSADCMQRMPGGRCKAGGPPTGLPDCTYSVEDAGEVLLNELVGIPDYAAFWEGTRNKEYDPDSDDGIGNHFWAGKHDAAKCNARLEAVRHLFGAKFPQFPVRLEEPPCDFDMYYEGELDWSVNHTGADPSPWWDTRM